MKKERCAEIDCATMGYDLTIPTLLNVKSLGVIGSSESGTLVFGYGMETVGLSQRMPLARTRSTCSL